MTAEAQWRIVPLERSHVADAIRIHRVAFAGYPHVALGQRYLARMFASYVEEPGAIALAALGPDDRLVGYVFGSPSDGLQNSTRILRTAAVLGILRRPWLLARSAMRQALRRRVGSLAERQPATGTMHLVGVAVDVSKSRRGCGAALLLAFERESVRRGASKMQLAVYDGNAPAQALYSRSGWTLLSRPGKRSSVLTYAKELRQPVGV